jgi:hypothetical protein
LRRDANRWSARRRRVDRYLGKIDAAAALPHNRHHRVDRALRCLAIGSERRADQIGNIDGSAQQPMRTRSWGGNGSKHAIDQRIGRDLCASASARDDAMAQRVVRDVTHVGVTKSRPSSHATARLH